MAELASKLRTARTNAGLSLRQLERESGVGRGLLSRYERGEVRHPRARNVKRIAEALSISADWLLG
jgi:transcriptional regulator with XRE-family HTH domain